MINLGGFFQTFVWILFSVLDMAILVRVLMSWFPISPTNPFVRVIFEITEPVIAPFRRVLPQIGFIDLSPLAALLVLNFVATQVFGVRPLL